MRHLQVTPMSEEEAVAKIATSVRQALVHSESKNKKSQKNTSKPPKPSFSVEEETQITVLKSGLEQHDSAETTVPYNKIENENEKPAKGGLVGLLKAFFNREFLFNLVLVFLLAAVLLGALVLALMVASRFI